MQDQWMYSSRLTSDDFKLFYSAAGKNPNAFHPIAISNLDGMRYRFICNTLKASSKTTNFAVVELYKPRKGSPYLTKVFDIQTDV